ncbi:MAG: FAD:protein FMN transferase [Thermoleophilia bacterium]|nr:FAD:protein FMN transferase [Thermoleophilia bacterium]
MTGAVLHAEEVMGTVVSFDVRPGHLTESAARAAIARACALLHDVDATFSTWKPASPINRFRRGEARIEDLPAEVYDVLELCALAGRMSGGWFDAWAMPGGFDPTGLVKGWAAARALGVLRAAGAAAAVVNAGGDVAVHGRPAPDRPWAIAVTNPADTSQVVCIVDVEASIATSGTYERGEHVLDPHTGAAASVVASATVVGPDLALADALATAIVAGGIELLATLQPTAYAGLIIEHDGAIRATPGFPVQVTDVSRG